VAGGAVAGGAAAAFLNNPESLQRPATGQRPGDGPAGNRPDRVDNRADRVDNRVGSRPERIDNRGERQQQRVSRRDEVRDQFRDHHPRYDFWQSHPHAARWRWNRPYRWATWTLITGWFPWGWSEPSQYLYGENIYYQDNSVYYGENVAATTEQYAQQAEDLASSAPEPADDTQWLPLGVFAVTQDGQASGPPPTIFLQLTVNKEGIIAGTVTNTEAPDNVQAIEGMVDKKTQRSAWVIQGKSSPIMETGIANLTKDEAPVLLHFADGQTQQWLLIRLEEPEGETATQ
jgi:hypothetical protein